MTIARGEASERSLGWVIPVTRAALAAVPAIVITFSPDHTPAFGLIAFGWWALVSGLVVGALGLRLLDRGDGMLFAGSGAVSAAAGILAITLPGGLGFLLYLVSVWAAVTGFLELFAGLRARARAARVGRRSAQARDWITVGAMTAVLAVALLLLPPNAVVAVGLLGAYLVIVAVYLVIAGLSLRWDRSRAIAVPNPEEAT